MYFLTDTNRPGSHEYAHRGCSFRKREACLMAMSYSYEMHIKVLECMAVLAQSRRNTYSPEKSGQ